MNADERRKARLRANARAYARRHPEVVRARYLAWRAKNAEKAREATRRWRKANPDKDAAATARWRARNAATISATKRQWRVKNKHRMRAYDANRRAWKKKTAIPLTPQEQAEIIAIYAKARALTELIGEPYHVDHIKPLCKGGLHHPSNLQVLRGIDNLRKGSRT